MRINTPSQIDAMRKSGQILGAILQQLKTAAVAGVTPKQLSAIARAELAARGAKPVFEGFHGFPDVICISVNDVVQHAIPNDVPLVDGDIVNLDFGVLYDGMVTDSGLTFCVGGNPSADDARLLKGTEKALYAAIDMIRDGVRVGDVSATIEQVLRKHKLGIVRELVGHGVGLELHEDPEIPNYGKSGRGPKLQAGMTIAVEPITTLGRPDICIESDGWTIKSVDQTRSAQFEHTLLVTKTGCEILTLAD